MNKKGFFISLEGVDGCGKTTLIKALSKRLTEQGYTVTSLREPGGAPVSEAIRALLLDPSYTDMAPRTEALLYASARAQVCEQIIRPALSSSDFVIADRFIDSTIAYQGYGRGLDIAFLQQLNALCTDGLTPDLTLLLDIDPKIAQLRRADRESGSDRLEQEGLLFQQRIRKVICKSPVRIRNASFC